MEGGRLGTGGQELGETPLLGSGQLELAFSPCWLFLHPPLGVSTTLPRIWNGWWWGAFPGRGESNIRAFRGGVLSGKENWHPYSSRTSLPFPPHHSGLIREHRISTYSPRRRVGCGLGSRSQEAYQGWSLVVCPAADLFPGHPGSLSSGKSKRKPHPFEGLTPLRLPPFYTDARKWLGPGPLCWRTGLAWHWTVRFSWCLHCVPQAGFHTEFLSGKAER